MNVGWAHIKGVDGTASFPNNDVLQIRNEHDKDEIGLEHAQGNKSETYTAVLANNHPIYSQNVTAKVTSPENGDIEVKFADGNSIKNNETKYTESGGKMTIRFKPDRFFRSVKVIRNSDESMLVKDTVEIVVHVLEDGAIADYHRVERLDERVRDAVNALDALDLELLSGRNDNRTPREHDPVVMNVSAYAGA